MLRGVRRGFVLLAAGTALAAGGGAAAQRPPAGAVVQPLPGADEGAELRRHLADLAANPRSVVSLVGAGRAALRVGDGQAALGFFARAEEIAPSDARVKAGMASAFVLTGRGDAALRYFADAARLGAPETEIARDRGLAFDMSGNPRRAQQDYALVLQRGDDAETRRRMALSLAISGHRDAALRAIDPLLRRRDTAAYRTRAFVLALTGDANGAAQAVDAAMPGQGSAMAPFLSRLAGLNPAQKAMAVHFGHFPADGRPVQMAQAIDTSAHPAAVALTGAAPAAPARTTAQPAQPVARRRTALAEPLNRDRRRPATDDIDRSGRVGPGSRGGDTRRSSSDARVAASTPIRPPQQQAPRTAAASPLIRTAPAQQQPRTATPSPQPGFSTAPLAAANRQPVQVATAQPLEIPPAMRQDSAPEPAVRQAPAPAASLPSPAASEPAPAFVPPLAAAATTTIGAQEPTVTASAAPAPVTPTPAEAQPAPASAVPAFSDIAALVQSLPAEEEARAAAAAARTPAPSTAPATRAAATPARTTAPAATRTAAAGRTATPAARTAARTPAPPAHPARHWVQVANGAPGALAFELGRIRRAAPELMRGRTAWSAANGASGRLLVGPFETIAAARAFINQLAGKDVAAFPWSSRAGEEVARLPAR